ncbi:xin actin-binding repeat-containing protein 1 [Gastrophryne carolinensis]
MADHIVKLCDEKKTTDLPLPTPAESVHHLVTVPGAQDQSMMPPPPKESFSKFYEQRKINELKRLYRHMHPELRKNLEHAVTKDIAELLSTDEPSQQTSVKLDAVLPGDVQSMRWIFENWNLDTIGEHQGSHKLTEDETVLGKDVKCTSLMFQGQTCVDGSKSSPFIPENNQTRGDVKTALWLFETQPLDSLNKIYPEDTDVQEVVLKDTVEKGDVKGTKSLFESQSLDEIGRCNSVEEQSILQLKSEIQEMKGDVNKTIKLFQTEPLCAIRDKTGNFHEIKSICREETQSKNVNSARWLFETQPLDTIHKDTTKVQIIRGVSLEEIAKGGVNATRWIFETQPLDSIQEHIEEGVFQASTERIQVENESGPKEEVIPGDVKSTMWLFETQPMEALKGSFDVGQLKKVELLNEEKGDVKQKKHVFETCSLDKISHKEEETSNQFSTDTKEILKGEVKTFKNLFEKLPLDSIRTAKNVNIFSQEDIQRGNVKANQELFESTPLYAIEDSLGNYHEVTSVSREQVLSGDVKNYKWMFETKPLDQFDNSTQKVDIIKGITKQEIVSGDVGTAKWLFETQPINISKDSQCTDQKDVIQKGDVKKCRWLFETQPIDMLYDKSEEVQKEAPVHGDVKSYTWMFETQPLDSIKDTEVQYLRVNSVSCGDSKGVNVETTKHLFETETLEGISSDRKAPKVIRYSSRVEIQSGKVSRVKEMFESKPNYQSDIPKADFSGKENIEAGSVNKFTWLFQNCPMDSIKINEDGFQELPPEKDIQGGDVEGKKFKFETYSLDQIHENSEEKAITKVQESLSKGDVKSCTMLFENKPLYAIQDKSGEYHEVTSVRKEEIQKGDVRGAKWLFETKPLDCSINKDEEVFVIRAVTQEDIEKGCVKAARWRFETEPLDTITDITKHIERTADDIQKGDVQLNKQIFETEQASQKKYVRMVSVSDVQKGNVRTSTWLFENQPIDSLKGEEQEHQGIVKVQREDNQKGDVKRCTWLFESQPLDSLKDKENTPVCSSPEDIPTTNVKSTTWMFESTPLDQFDLKKSTSIKEINVKETLDAFLSCNIIQNKGIVIENIYNGIVKMLKYQVSAQSKAEIQKEENVGGNLQRILLQLLHRTDVESYGLLIEEGSSGHLEITNLNLLNTAQSQHENREFSTDDVAKALKILVNEDISKKTGIIMEESEQGSVKIIIYYISSHCNFNVTEEVIAKGDVKSTIGSLLACTQEGKPNTTVAREQHEKGNVQLYTSCIEKGDLGYLKSLQDEAEIDALTLTQSKPTDQEKNSTEEQNVAKQSNNLHPKDLECVKITSTPIFHPVLPPQHLQECREVDTAEANNNYQKGTLGRKVEKRDITLHKASQVNTVMQKSAVTRHATEEKKASTSIEKCGVEGSVPSVIQNPSSNTDLQAALLDLRQATAEAQSIQQHVQCKYQKTSQEMNLTKKTLSGNVMQPIQATLHQECAAAKHTTSVMTEVQEKQTSYASLKKSATSTKKVSVSQENEEKTRHENIDIHKAEHVSVKDDAQSPTQAKTFLNPFIEHDYNSQLVQEAKDEEIVRGDVKAAIKALRNASTEQRVVEKEEVIRGNLTCALQSLQKSNVNVSKGDFKAAMIYRNAGQSTASKKKIDIQQNKSEPLITSVQSSDNNSPSSPAAVTGQGKCQAPNRSNVEASRVDSTKANDPGLKDNDLNATKTCEKTPDKIETSQNTSQSTQRKKPIPPPKPKHLQPGTCPSPRQKAKTPMTSTPAISPPPNNSPYNLCSTVLPNPENMSKHAHVPTDVLIDTPFCENENFENEILSHQIFMASITNEINPDDFKAMPEFPSNENVLHQCSSRIPNEEKTCTAKDGQLEPIAEDKATVDQHLASKEELSGRISVINKETSVCNPNDTKGVVMRVKKRKETEDEKRKRLSIHMDEIMKDNVKAATDIFENLRKQDELETILKKVEEFEEESSRVDVKSVKGIFETVPDWITSKGERASPHLNQKEGFMDESLELLRDDTESVSSVELAFEDLEKASTEIKHLKEQTMARLLDIEETIKKALYSVSNLKSESDIASLSSLFRESLETSSNTSNNIRKISIVSSKSKLEKPVPQSKQIYVDTVTNREAPEKKKTELELLATPSRISPTSPSFITIESAARKPTQQNGSSNKNSQEIKDPFSQLNNVSCNIQHSPANLPGVQGTNEKTNLSKLSLQSSPSSQRQKSVLEVKTGSEGPKVIGTTIVTEKYEESDQYGNKVIRSKTSTTVTQQSDTQSSSTYGVVTASPRYEVTASPLLKRHVMSSAENSNSKANETGVVFVTFANSKPA